MIRIAPLALVLAGCMPLSPAAAQPQPLGVQLPPAAVVPVATLTGKWRIASIDGQAVTEHQMVLEASDREIWWSPRCAGYVRSYRIAGSSFTTGPYLGWEPPRPGDPPIPICLIAPPSRMGRVFSILTGATDVRRTSENGVEISGRDRSLLLFPL